MDGGRGRDPLNAHEFNLMKTQTENFHVNPDDKHILSATAKEVILRGEHRSQPCVLKITRETYFAAMTKWLDGKARYAGETGEYGGVGDIIFEATPTTEKQSAWLNIEDQRISVATYTATRFFVDMEYG